VEYESKEKLEELNKKISDVSSTFNNQLNNKIETFEESLPLPGKYDKLFQYYQKFDARVPNSNISLIYCNISKMSDANIENIIQKQKIIEDEFLEDEQMF
jgi:hypothetical protein